ncbi:MAG: DUF1475 family protein [Halofilum sp. (in: g-proteobacteria)]|nr:DUF1475 family protein [Halofilum sp. (in: g-proteobacteria)]
MPEQHRLPVTGVAAFVVLLALALVAALLQGLGSSLVTQGGLILDVAWGRALMVDLYVGLLLISGWILWREPRRAGAAGWVAALLLLGNIVACIYVLLALHNSHGDARAFWNGKS